MENIKKQLLSHPFLLFGLIFFEIILLLIPLTNALDFEFSVANALIFSFLGGIFGLRYNSKESVTTGITNLCIISLIPFFLGLIYTLIFSECPLTSNFIFYFLFVIPASVFGFAVGSAAKQSGIKFAAIFFIFIYLLILIQTVIDIYHFPQVFSYNPLFGFFPGTIYDDYIPFTSVHVLFSLYTLISAGALLFAVHSTIFTRIRPLFRIGIIIVFSFVFYFVKVNSGFCTTKGVLRSELEKSIVTDHFIINYDESSDSTFGAALALSHEYYYRQLNLLLGTAPSQRIESFVFRDKFQKQKLFGAGNADVAKPWVNQIYIQAESYRSTLKHELAHVFLAIKGVTIFKVADNFNPALIEGFAMAIENDFGGRDIDEMAALAKSENYSIGIKELFAGLNFFGNYSSLSYIYAGSFIKFLFYKFGSEKTLNLYSNCDFEQVFGVGIDSLQIDFNRYLDSVKVNFRPQAADLYFGRQPIFKKVCPRVVAKEMLSAAELYRDSSFAEAAEEYREIFAYSGTFTALLGLAKSELKIGNVKSIKKLLTENIDNFSKSANYYSYLLLMGDVSALSNDSSRAENFYSRIIENYPTVDYLNAAVFKKYLLNRGSESIKAYIHSNKDDKFDILYKLNTDSLISESIPSLIAYSKGFEQNTLSLLKKHAKSFEITDILRQNAAIEISNWLFDRLEFDTAEYYIKLAAEYNSEYFSKLVFDELALVKWCIKNKELLRKAEFYDESDNRSTK